MRPEDSPLLKFSVTNSITCAKTKLSRTRRLLKITRHISLPKMDHLIPRKTYKIAHIKCASILYIIVFKQRLIIAMPHFSTCKNLPPTTFLDKKKAHTGRRGPCE